MSDTPTGKKAAKPGRRGAGGEKGTVNQGRHEAQCSICALPLRAELEQAFVHWEDSTSKIAKKYSVSRDSIYRHAHALNLLELRRRNIRAALYHIIENASTVEVTAAAVVSAVSVLARINSRGEWVERTETVNLNALFDRMSADEMDRYARDGSLPTWFDTAVAASGANSQSERNGA